MTVLVTGATGFLGSHLCRRLTGDGYKVRILCRPTSDLSLLGGLPAEKVTGDVTDSSSVFEAVSGADWVIHAAARGSYWDDPVGQMRVNVDGTRNVAHACREGGVARLLHVSSIAAIGIPPDGTPATEEFVFNLDDENLNYHRSKHLAEAEVLKKVEQGLDAVIVNPASIFGPHGRRYRLAEMMQKVRRTRVVPYFSGGLCAVHVEDVVDGIVAALRSGRAGQRYILGGENLTYRSLVERAAKAMNLKRYPVPVPPIVTGLAARVLEPWGRWRRKRPRLVYATHYCSNRLNFYDSGKACRALGYNPRVFQNILLECMSLGAC
jgi:dihydroflavonol-4-reductase